MSLPLEGLRIVAVTQYGAGPYSAMHMADLGAEVIKIEDPSTNGDVGREVIPNVKDNDSLFYQAFNRNNQSITLNFRVSESQDIFHKLVKVSDVVLNNMRGDLPRKLGLDYESLKGVNPKIVCCSLSGYGTSGSRAKEPAYDYIIAGLTGLQSITGDPGTPPTKPGISVIDYATGFAAAMSVLAGVHGSQKTGRGCDIDVSLFDVAISMMNYLAAWHLNAEFSPVKMADSAHPSLIPSQNFTTKDSYVVVMCNKEGFWQRLCQAMDLAELLEDKRFTDFEARWDNQDVLLTILKDRFKQKTTDHWLSTLREARVPVGPINSFKEAFDDPFLQERDMIWEVESPVWGKIRVAGCPVHIAGETSPRQGAPTMGQDTVPVLSKLLGYSPTEIDSLREKGAI